ncbi:MAG TPA: YfiR family protein [Sphingobium sp.]|nr:YfiR family protein [Sphingobium sp.]
MPWRHGGGGGRYGRAKLAGLILIGLLPQPAGASSPANLERAVKASFLLKFAPFVEWPPAAFTAADRNFVICVTGEDPFGNILNDVVRGQRMKQRPVSVRRLGTAGSAAGCHILYAGRSAEAEYAPFPAAGSLPILTVSDKSTGPTGAMIAFLVQGGRVRFQIDDGAARASGLKISSKLLALAVTVNRK